MTQNSYADISDYIESLQKEEKIRKYPEGLVEASYTIAAGNFGWLNVIMAHCDQYLNNHPDAEAGQILLDLSQSVPRFKDSLIDISQLDYIDSSPVYQLLLKKALLRQLPVPKQEIPNKSNKYYYQQKIFKEFLYLKNLLLFHLLKVIWDFIL